MSISLHLCKLKVHVASLSHSTTQMSTSDVNLTDSFKRNIYLFIYIQKIFWKQTLKLDSSEKMFSCNNVNMGTFHYLKIPFENVLVNFSKMEIKLKYKLN